MTVTSDSHRPLLLGRVTSDSHRPPSLETGRARLAGHFPELEDQLRALTWAGYQGAGSPDRADAMVWAMTELFEKARAEPRIRRL